MEVALAFLVVALLVKGTSRMVIYRPIAFAPAFSLRSDAADSLEKAVAESDAPRITSAYRTRTEQERLYALFLAGKGSLAAKPGTSLHESGIALDARGSPQWEAAMVRNGWTRPLLNHPKHPEPWHWEFRR